jgi:glutathione S-transferase
MIKIYGIPLSVHVRKTVVASILKGLDYEITPVVPLDPPDGWAALSPTGLIPVIEDNGYTLADSSAICQYFERVQPAVPILPETPAELGRALWFDAYAGNLFRDVVHGLFFETKIRPGMLSQATDRSVVDRILAGATPKYFAYLDSQAGERFLVGDAFSLADIAIASNLVNYLYLGFRIDEAAYPRLARYARETIAMPVFQAALASEEPYAQQMRLHRLLTN